MVNEQDAGSSPQLKFLYYEDPYYRLGKTRHPHNLSRNNVSFRENHNATRLKFIALIIYTFYIIPRFTVNLNLHLTYVNLRLRSIVDIFQYFLRG